MCQNDCHFPQTIQYGAIIMSCREGGRRGKERNEEGGKGRWRKGQYLYLRVGYATVYGRPDCNNNLTCPR